MPMVRPIRPADVEALYAISLATGFEGGNASRLYDDPKLMGHIYSAPYAVLHPQLSLVVEDSRGVAGFAVGATDTRGWEDLLEREWWPQLRRRYPNPPEATRDVWTPDERRAAMIHRPVPTPEGVVRNYPAHVHINLLPRIQGRGLGSALFAEWRRIAAGQGAGSVHVGVNRANTRAIRFWGMLGFVELLIEGAESGRTAWMGKR